MLKLPVWHYELHPLDLISSISRLSQEESRGQSCVCYVSQCHITLREAEMSIDLSTETLVTFAKLATSLPSRRRNHPVHLATIHLWRRPGLKGIRIEAIRVGGAGCTTRKAFSRFCAQLTASGTGEADMVFTYSAQRAQHWPANQKLIDNA